MSVRMKRLLRVALVGLLSALPVAPGWATPLTDCIDRGRRAVLGNDFSAVSETEQAAYLLACYKVDPGRFKRELSKKERKRLNKQDKTLIEDNPAFVFDLGLFTFVESLTTWSKTEAEIREEIRVRAEALGWILCEVCSATENVGDTKKPDWRTRVSAFWRQGQSVRAGVPMPGEDDAEPFLTWAIWNLRESPSNRPLSEETLAIVIGAIKKKNADVAKRLCDQRDRHGTLPLFLAIQEGHNQVAKAIVQVYGPEDLKALRGNEFAGDDGMRVMDCAVLADNAEMVEYLIRSGWDISDERTWGGPCGPNGRRLSPLIKAEANGKRKASQKLQEIELSRERQKEKREKGIWRQL